MKKMMLVEQISRIHNLMGINLLVEQPLPPKFLTKILNSLKNYGDNFFEYVEKKIETQNIVNKISKSTKNLVETDLKLFLKNLTSDGLKKFSKLWFDDGLILTHDVINMSNQKRLSKILENEFNYTKVCQEIESGKKTFWGMFPSGQVPDYLVKIADEFAILFKKDIDNILEKNHPEKWKNIENGNKINVKIPINNLKIEPGSVYRTYGTPKIDSARKQVYFNRVEKVENETVQSGKIKIIDGNNNEYIYDLGDLKSYEDKFSNKMNIKVTQEKFGNTSKILEQPNLSKDIKNGIKNAFPSNWYIQDEKYTAGLKDVFPIKNYIEGQNSNWSVLNWFDTRSQTKDKLYEQFKKSKSEKTFEDWFSDFLKSNNPEDITFLEKLCQEQAKSIKSGIDTELKFIDAFSKKYKTNNIELNEFGTIKDRYLGIDVTIDGVNYQIKPATSKLIEEGDSYQVRTNKTIINYNSQNVKKIVFVNQYSKEIYIFDNVNVKVSGNVVTFKNKPEIMNM